jgi:hypothetical protein
MSGRDASLFDAASDQSAASQGALGQRGPIAGGGGAMHPDDAAKLEVDILMKEFETLRDEEVTRIESQTQLASIALLLIGAVVTAAPFLLLSGNQSHSLSIPPIYLLNGLLIISALFTSMLWTLLEHDIKTAYMSHYFNFNIRTRAAHLLGLDANSAHILNWDRYQLGRVFPRKRSLKALGGTGAAVLLYTSRYGLMAVPAVATLAAAGFVWSGFVTLPPRDGLGWLDVGIFAFDAVYFVGAVLFALYISRQWQAIVRRRAEVVL